MAKVKQVALECRQCGNRTYIWRKQGKLRERGHVKRLWCIECRDRTAHVELEDYGRED